MQRGKWRNKIHTNVIMVVDLPHRTTLILDASSFVEGARKYFIIFIDMMPLNRIE